MVEGFERRNEEKTRKVREEIRDVAVR